MNQKFLGDSNAYNFECQTDGSCGICLTNEGALQVLVASEKPIYQFVSHFERLVIWDLSLGLLLDLDLESKQLFPFYKYLTSLVVAQKFLFFQLNF